MNRRRLSVIAAKIIQLHREPYLQAAGAQLAFYLVMSIVPLIILLVQMCAFFTVTPELIQRFLAEYLSPQALQLADSVLFHIQQTGSGAFGGVTVLATLWAASKIQYCIVGICNYAYTGRLRMGSFLRERILSIFNIVLFLVLLMASLIVLVYGKVILEVIAMVMDRFLHIPFQFSSIWYWIRWPIAAAVYMTVISCIYYISPAKRQRFRQVLPGGIFAGAAMVVASLGYSVYVAVFANFDALYGSLASFVALLFWFYLLGKIFVGGIMLNLAWEETKYLA